MQQAIDKLREGGFTQRLHVFAEPGLTSAADNVVVHGSAIQLGGFKNYLRALKWLYENTDEPYLLLVEDDVNYCVSACTRLLTGISTYPDAAAFNLYLPVRYRVDYPNVQPGWFSRANGKRVFGLLATCYKREHIAKFAQAIKLDNVPKCFDYDWRIFKSFDATGADYLGHYPSLVDHIGQISTLNHQDGPHRRGWDFRKDF